MNEVKISIALFNRATFSRVKALLDLIHIDKDIKLNLILGSALLDKEYGEAADYIKRDYSKFDITNLSYNSYKGNPNRICLVSADILKGMSEHLLKNKPDCLIVVADRFETLPAAMASSYLNIPTLQIQAGEVTGNLDEKIRHSVTKLSDYQICNTTLSKQYVVAMGEEFKRVFTAGCTSIDFVKRRRLHRWTPKERYMISIFHPDTNNLENNAAETEVLLNAAVDFCYKKNQKCYWYWPNPDPGREDLISLLTRYHERYPKILVKAINKEPFDFINQAAGATIAIGNSSCLIREFSSIGIPCVNIGDRQSVRERSWNIKDCEPVYEELMKTFDEQYSVKRYKSSNLYGYGKASEKIVNILKRIEFTLKGHLTYPLNFQYREDHLGEQRFIKHKLDGKKSKQLVDSVTERKPLSGKSFGP
jgi:UDP-hydrolysing UDP-N-acetyl-D-glucosamine 2-epimerase